MRYSVRDSNCLVRVARKVFSRVWPMAVLVSMAMVLSACDHKEIYMRDSELVQARIDFDFSQLDQTPAAMRVLFYPIWGGQQATPYKFDLSGEGGYVSLPAGDYSVLAYNIDAENILERDEDEYDSFALTTQSWEVELGAQEIDQPTGRARVYMRQLFGSQVPKDNDEGEFLLYDAPEWTCRAIAELFRVESRSLGSTPQPGGTMVTSHLTLVAEPAVCTVEVHLKGIEGLARVDITRGTLSGIPCASYMKTRAPSSDLGMVSFAGQVLPDLDEIYARFYVWGYFPPDVPDARQFLNIYIWSDGGNYYVTQEVTDRLRAAEQERLRRLELTMTSDLNLMDGSGGNSGFRPILGGWEEHASDLPLW